ncbi:unnamed protein product [Adineta steineri]|uniref:RING-type domain-containing protein n=1 Tax=Adineta steineri TaxID=433720 RepID=A0A815EG53_9BILA|nr:unnamed protein product [Adineta steineri]CAF3759735.1 unnamed protein product [Adineta steineri]
MTTTNNLTQPNKIIFSSSDISKQEKIVQERKYSLNEIESIRQARIRSLSHWPHLTPSIQSMALAGWFSCNVNDRVICIYCNTICQEWTSNDNPAEVHARLAPQCTFVLTISSKDYSPKIINGTISDKFEPIHPAMAEISRRQATFSNATYIQNLPDINDLVDAGFFFSGISNVVTCFYCNGSLFKWSPNDNPVIEHARWFPNCIYGKHLCGDKLYERIQVLKRKIATENKINSNELSRLVAARLDLPIVERLRSQYSLAIIKRCFEDQLRIKNDDFTSDIDLSMACLILKKQIDHIKGCKDTIKTPVVQQEQLEKSIDTELGECFICLTEDKQLACMPCGHLCACVPCGYALHSCPICREKIQSFIRLNS